MVPYPPCWMTINYAKGLVTSYYCVTCESERARTTVDTGRSRTPFVSRACVVLLVNTDKWGKLMKARHSLSCLWAWNQRFKDISWCALHHKQSGPRNTNHYLSRWTASVDYFTQLFYKFDHVLCCSKILLYSSHINKHTQKFAATGLMREIWRPCPKLATWGLLFQMGPLRGLGESTCKGAERHANFIEFSQWMMVYYKCSST